MTLQKEGMDRNSGRITSVAAAHWVSAEQPLSFVEDTKALPMGVFVTAADEAELEALEQDARWTSRLIVSDAGVAAAIALTSPADVFSAPYSLGGSPSLGPGSLPNGARVSFELPQEAANSAASIPLVPLRDLSVDLGGSDWCARWTLEDGTKGSVAPIVDTLDGWRTRMICEIPPIEQFRHIEIGASVDVGDAAYETTRFGRGSVFIASLVIPITSQTDTTEIPSDARSQTLRAETYVGGGLQLWGVDGESAKEGRSYENATSLAPGDFFQVMFYDSGAYVWSTTLIQAAWVLVGLAGGWAGVALYRLLRGPSAGNTDA